MEIKIIKVTDKGQISLPVGIRESLRIKQGDELFITKNEDAIVIKKVKKEDFSYLLKHSEKVAKKLWDNKEDEVWDSRCSLSFFRFKQYKTKTSFDFIKRYR